MRPFVFAFAVLSLASCSEEGGGPIDAAGCEEPTGEGTTHSDEAITSSTVWDEEGSPHRVLGSVTVAGDGARLEIRRCTVVEFGEGASLVVGEGGTGILTVRGDAGDPIVFRAADGGGSGSWVGLRFGPQTATATRVDNLTLENAGGPSGRPEGDAAIVAWGDETATPDVALVGVQVLGSGADGILFAGAVFDDTSGALHVSGAAGHPVVLEAEQAGDLPTGGYADNGVDAIGVRGGVIDDVVGWGAGDIPYHVLGDIVIEGKDSGSLTVSTGVAVWMDPGTAIRAGETLPGRFVAVGESADRVVISGPEGDETPGSWRGIVIGPESTLSTFQSATVAGAGGPDPDGGEAAAISIRGRGDTGPSVEIHDLEIRGSAGYGLSVLSGATLDSSSTYLEVNDGVGYQAHVEAANAASLPREVVGEGNAQIGIVVEGGTVAASGEWDVITTPYVIAGTISVEGSPPPLLTLGEGTTLRFREGTALEIGRGAEGDVRAAGTNDLPITLTADAGTDPGSWVGVVLLSGMANETVFSEVVVEYAGADAGFTGETCGSADAGNFVIVGAPAEFVSPPFGAVHDCVLHGSAGYGIAMDRDIDADLTTPDERNVFEDNALGDQSPSGC